MLLGNFNQFNKNPGRSIGGPSDPTLWFKAATTMNFYTPSNYTTSQISQASFPNGSRPKYSFILAPKGGGMAMNTSGVGTLNNVRIKGNRAIVGNLTGNGILNPAALGLVKGMVANLTASGSLTGSLAGSASMKAGLTALATVNGNIGGVGELIASLNGNGNLVANLTAIGYMIANLTPFTPLSPESLAASLWNSIAANYNVTGTMGKALNSAGSAGDPWITDLATYTTPGSAGKTMKDIKNNTLAGL